MGRRWSYHPPRHFRRSHPYRDLKYRLSPWRASRRSRPALPTPRRSQNLRLMRRRHLKLRLCQRAPLGCTRQSPGKPMRNTEQKVTVSSCHPTIRLVRFTAHSRLQGARSLLRGYLEDENGCNPATQAIHEAEPAENGNFVRIRPMPKIGVPAFRCWSRAKDSDFDGPLWNPGVSDEGHDAVLPPPIRLMRHAGTS
jgi:hypothetical protein